jgi:hypothetical protein
MADTPLVDIAQLTTLLKQEEGSLDDDPYTALMIEAASAVVRDEGNPDWTLETIPSRGRFIALYLARRAWEDPGNLSRRTAGPLSESFFENGVKGLDLTEAEREWLDGKKPGGGSDGTWIMKVRSGSRRPFEYGVETLDGFSFAAGDWNFAHGMDVSGRKPREAWQ